MDQIELLRRNELTQEELKNTKRKDKVRGAKKQLNNNKRTTKTNN